VQKKKLDIDIPAGIDDGMVIKLTGEGNAGVGTKTS
jgi:DnaJ-class molecular chaperone